jgi:hypothetical protein
VTIQLGESPEVQPDSVYDVELNIVPREWSKAQTLDLIANVIFAASKHKETPAPYTLDIRRSDLEWGASAAAESIIVYIANHAADIAVVAALEHALARMIDFFQNLSPGQSAIDIDPSEMRERARWRIKEAFTLTDIAADRLELLSEEWSTDKWSFSFRDDSWAYAVQLSLISGLPSCIFTRRERLSSD